MPLLDDAKKALRISAPTTDFDGEIQDLIDAAKADLQLAGVVSEDETDPLIKRALIVYCKANFGYDNPDADRLIQSYNLLKAHLTLAEDYISYAVTFKVTSGGVPVDEATITVNDETTAKTNSQGVAVFTTTKAVDFDYIVSKTGYQDSEGSVYVDASKTVEVALNAA